MSATSFSQILAWIVNLFVGLTAYVTRSFAKTPPEDVLPVASPVAPSTPSFIQTHELPEMSNDAMKIFHLNCGQPRASRIARHKMALMEFRNGPPSAHLSQTLSVTPTDPSPGFSVLSMVHDNLAPVGEAPDSPSIYSSAPSSPRCSMNTPNIVVSTTLGEFPPVHDFAEPGCFPIRDGRVIPPRETAHEERPTSQDVLPSVTDLAKRRLFKGPPIVTDIPKDLFIPSRCTTPVKEAQIEVEEEEDPHFLSPRSVVFSDVFRLSTTPRTSSDSHRRSSSRDSNLASPECQDVFKTSNPFSTYSDSFYMDDHVPSPQMVDTDIYELSFYSDIGSTLNLSTTRSKRTRLSHLPTTIEEEPAELLGKSETASQVVEADTSYASPLESPTLKNATLDCSFLPAMSLTDLRDMDDTLSSNEDQLPLESEYFPSLADPETLERLGLYTSLTLPFHLEEEVPLDICPNIQRKSAKLNSGRQPLTFNSPTIRSKSLDSGSSGSVYLAYLRGRLESESDLASQSSSTKRPRSLTDADLPGHRTQTPPLTSLRDSKELSIPSPPSPIVPISPLSIKKKNRNRNRSATIIPPSRSLEGSADDFVQLPYHSTATVPPPNGFESPCSALASTSCSSDYGVDSTSSPLATHSPVESASSVDSVLASPASPADIYSPATSATDSLFVSFKAQESHKLGTMAGDLETLPKVGQQDIVDVVPIGKSRSRRVGIYGGLPQQMVAGLLIDPGAPCTDDEGTSHNRRKDVGFPTSTQPKRASALRPLVLPMQVAKRESVTAPSTRNIAPTLLQAATLSSIGLPPAQPLPDVPKGESPTKALSALLASSGSERERLTGIIDLLQEMDFTAEDDLYLAERRGDISSNSKMADDDWDAGSRDDHHINWGVAI